MKDLPEFSTWGETWKKEGWNCCLRRAAEALDFLAQHDRPMGGESSFNSIDLDSISYDVVRTVKAMNDHITKLEGK